MQLTLNHLTIRPFTLNDVDDVAEYMTDAKATYFLAEGCLSKEAVIRFVTETKQAFAILHQGSKRWWVISSFPLGLVIILMRLAGSSILNFKVKVSPMKRLRRHWLMALKR